MSVAARIRRLLVPAHDLVALQRRRLLRRLPPGGTVLDAGCGDGEMSLLLARRGHRVVGVSNEPQALARARRRAEALGIAGRDVTFRLHDLARDGPPGQDFDAAVCFDVLEHIAADDAALRAVAASLRAGATLALTVPARPAPRLWGDRLAAAEDGGHVRRGYTQEELEALLVAAGLRTSWRAGLAGFFAQKGTSVARWLEVRGWRRRRLAWLAALRPLCRLDPLLPWPPYEWAVLARKPAGGDA
ncbi:MAG: class I SAM-dependent methyltransferase [Candidatus Brocadiia bacterium]